MNHVLSRWNLLSVDQAAKEILPCCGSRAWASSMVSSRPVQDVATLLATSDRIWRELSAANWLEAFRSHPRIGETRGPRGASVQSRHWSAQEQSHATESDDALRQALAEANREYEQRFHRLFIICAMGKSADEILANLRQRLNNDEATELQEAAEQQRQIAQIRLRKWLAE
ncbi:MAG: decarboxylase [Candidatus Acidoferrum typicum]|nr:decarboxylase [Candidatus Acidoferrum typicum]